MMLITILAGVAFFLVVVLVATYLFMKASKPEEPAETPTI